MVIRTLIVGHGYWGSILRRNLLAHPSFFVCGVCDPDPIRLRDAKALNLETYTSIEDALDESNPRLVVIATPIPTMMDIAHAAITRHASVMIAKPGPRSIDAADQLITAAGLRGVLVCVDYTMTMSPTFAAIRKRVGTANMINAIRVGHPHRSKNHIFDDLAIHDLSLIQAYDPTREWIVTDAAATDEAGFISLRADEATATIITRRVETITPRREFSVYGDHRSSVWDQLESESPTPVEARLEYLANAIRDHKIGNIDQIRTVTRLLEKAHAASERRHLA